MTDLNASKQLLFRPILWCLLLAIFGFSIGGIIEKRAHRAPDPADYIEQIEQELHQAEAEIEGLFNNGALLLNAVEGYILGDTVTKYINKPYTLLIYNDHDSVVYWNNNNILPYQSDIRYSRKDTIERYEMNASIYLKVHRPYDFLIDDSTYHYNLEALVPIYRHYSINNNYLQDHFSLVSKQVSEFIAISETPTDHAVKDRLGRPIVYVKAQPYYPYKWYIVFATLCYFLSSFLFLLGIHQLARQLSRKKGYVVTGALLLLGSFFLFRMVSIFYDFPFLANQYAIFNERLSDANHIWFYSLGDFLIDIGLLFWYALYITRTVRVNDVKSYLPWQQISIGASGYFFLVGGLAGIQFALRDIVMASFISFEFDDFSRLNLYSLLALTGIGFFLLSYFFLTLHFAKIFKTFQLPFKVHAGLFGVAWLFTIGISLAIDNWVMDQLVFTLAVVTHVFALYFFTQQRSTSLAWISIWLLLFSVFITMVIEHANVDKGIALRQEYAKKLAMERDLEMEAIFSSLVPKILDDGSLKISINSPLSPSPRRQAVKLLTYRYLDNYFFGRYDYSVHIYTSQGKPYRGEKRPYVDVMDFIHGSSKTTNPYLHFNSLPDGQYSYLAKLPLSENGALLGLIVVEFTPRKDFKKSNIYVELLSRNKGRLEQLNSQFTYALYKYQERVLTNGSNFKAQLAYDMVLPEPGQFHLLKGQGLEGSERYLVYRGHDLSSNIAIVTVPIFNTFKAFTIFAYIFCFGIFLLLSLQIANELLFRITKKRFIRTNFENSLREQIQRGIIMVTLASFVAIAIITILYYSSEYDDYHKSRLLRKISSTARTAVWQIHEGQDSIPKLPDARSLADIHKIDVNTYDLGGNLLSSSEKVVFERHLISRKMNPIAFQRLRNEQQNLVSQEEVINNFSYLSAYVPLKDKNDVTIAYLNLPYDLAGSRNIGSQDVAEFLGTLLNVYVIFLLIAGGAAFFIANSVTNPLSVIGAKLDAVELGKKNEPLIWNSRDEIGELVDRYNTMIVELEESTKKLARSQRESAWREMAKQVAHEIKNPLTPMKLNIQLLERVVNTNPEKAQKMVERVSKTLIEQIDSLAHIASEFSSFAKMPKANKEKLNINELVHNAYSLFKEEENMQVFLEMTEEECVVFADKTQIMRVLNNLLKNAIQAIPDDQPGIVKIALTYMSKKVLIRVSDNGCGIPKAQEDDIFVPNFTTKSSGTGIGLAMSKTIVEMANGRIYFTSEEGKGTDFFVELPAMPNT
ncbi:MAG: ATP-binding protein [Aureispira sp.]